MHRLFVALRPPAAMRGRLAEVMGGVPGARWQDDDQLHLTLRFVGEVDRHVARDVAAALGGVHAPAVPLAIAATGAFDRRGRVHSLVALAAAAPALLGAQRGVERAMARIGLPPEPRAFRPHVTLARLSAARDTVEPWLARTAGLSLPPAALDWFGLFESQLGREGARYELVERYPLVG